MNPSAGPLVRGNQSDRGSHAVSHNFFSVFSVAKCFRRISMVQMLWTRHYTVKGSNELCLSTQARRQCTKTCPVTAQNRTNNILRIQENLDFRDTTAFPTPTIAKNRQK